MRLIVTLFGVSLIKTFSGFVSDFLFLNRKCGYSYKVAFNRALTYRMLKAKGKKGTSNIMQVYDNLRCVKTTISKKIKPSSSKQKVSNQMKVQKDDADILSMYCF